MKVTIDRFEGEYAVVELENKKLVNLPNQLVPEGSGEGTVLVIDIDKEETQSRRKEMQGLMKNLWTD